MEQIELFAGRDIVVTGVCELCGAYGPLVQSLKVSGRFCAACYRKEYWRQVTAPRVRSARRPSGWLPEEIASVVQDVQTMPIECLLACYAPHCYKDILHQARTLDPTVKRPQRLNRRGRDQVDAYVAQHHAAMCRRYFPRYYTADGRHIGPHTVHPALKELFGMKSYTHHSHTQMQERENTIKTLYRRLGWDAARQKGIQTRQLGHADIRSAKEADTMIRTLEGVLMGYFRPHLPTFLGLVNLLATDDTLTRWERQFLCDVQRKIQTHQPLTVTIINKTRQIAHMHELACGFPGFRELSAQADAVRNRTHTHKETQSYGNEHNY